MEFVAIIINTIVLIIMVWTFYRHAKQYKEQSELFALSALLLGATEISKRTSRKETEEKKEINEYIDKNIINYAKRLIDNYEKHRN